MAFKKFVNYIEQKNGKFFVLRNDGDYADVIFLYKSYDDVMVCDAHYLKTFDYAGYVECCAEDYKQCPACSYGERGIQKQTKLFIPLYNITKGTLEFWDRNANFESVINDAVFKNYPNPSEFVFRVTRHGRPNDTSTTYEIIALGRNASYPYEKILSDHGLMFPEGYSQICKSMTPDEMSSCLSNRKSASNLSDYSYTPVPRGVYSGDTLPFDDIPETPLGAPQIDVPTTEYSAPPIDLPPVDIVPMEPTSADTDSTQADNDTVPTDSLDDIHF